MFPGGLSRRCDARNHAFHSATTSLLITLSLFILSHLLFVRPNVSLDAEFRAAVVRDVPDRTVSQTDMDVLQRMMHHTCNERAAFLPSLHAIAFTNVCYSPGYLIYKAVDDQKGAVMTTGVDCVGKNVPTDSRIFEKNIQLNSSKVVTGRMPSKPGIYFPLHNISKNKESSFKVHKYTHDLPSYKVVDVSGGPVLYRTGIALLLNEVHGNSNIGHAFRDTYFAAHILRHMAVDSILVKDPLSADPNPHRKAAMHALTSDSSTEIHWLPEMKDLSINKTKCFPVLLQKVEQFSGDVHAHEYLKHAAFKSCGISFKTRSDLILIVRHYGTRQWADRTSSYFIKSFEQQRWARHLRVVETSFHNSSFCEQVDLLRRSKVVVAHHGAVIEGNGGFISHGGVVIEIVSQFVMDPTINRTYIPLFEEARFRHAEATGTSAISAAVAYADTGKIDYYYDQRSRVLVNMTRWEMVLETLTEKFRGDMEL